MKRCVLLICSIILTVFAMPAAAGEIKAPNIAAQGAILIDFESGRTLWGKNADAPMAMASTTKIMTAVLALEMGNLSDTVTVSRRAAEAPKVKMYLSTGEKISLETLLYALMLQSSNDAAVAIAEHIGGTVEAFCQMMTDKAGEVGALDTVFESPNGLDVGDHHSTAYDMAQITRYALQNDAFVKLINTREYTGKSDKRTYHIINKNRLLTEFAGANGVKSGFTGKAGYCFIGSAVREDLWLISVVLASGWGSVGREQKWVDTKRVLSYGFDNFAVETVVTAGDNAGVILIKRSKTPLVYALYDETLKLPLSAAEKEGLLLDVRIPGELRAPVTAGDVVGVCDVYIGGEKYAELPVVAAASADRHDLKTSMEKVLGYFLEIVTEEDVKVTLPEF